MKSRTGGQQDTRERSAEKKKLKLKTRIDEREIEEKIETKTNSLLSYYQPTNNDD